MFCVPDVSTATHPVDGAPRRGQCSGGSQRQARQRFVGHQHQGMWYGMVPYGTVWRGFGGCRSVARLCGMLCCSMWHATVLDDVVIWYGAVVASVYPKRHAHRQKVRTAPCRAPHKTSDTMPPEPITDFNGRLLHSRRMALPKMAVPKTYRLTCASSSSWSKGAVKIEIDPGGVLVIHMYATYGSSPKTSAKDTATTVA